jgi:ABC-type branched-subunit amino acid transport system permease subunit
MIRFLAFLFSGFWSGVAGLLYLYYNQFVSPQAVALTASAEALLMVIAGGTATLLGPIAGAALVVIMKNVVSAYIERWNFVLGAIAGYRGGVTGRRGASGAARRPSRSIAGMSRLSERMTALASSL